MWREETRFDMQFMQRALASDFFEFGRSGRMYTREQSLAVALQPLDAVLPLPDLSIRMLARNTAQGTYSSVVTYDGVLSTVGGVPFGPEHRLVGSCGFTMERHTHLEREAVVSDRRPSGIGA